ncbi:MAG: hypothetical protein P1V97_30000 [Planctomycetota bacterium]|nr:hypothetical protein [Planctomycetota bacterium]
MTSSQVTDSLNFEQQAELLQKIGSAVYLRYSSSPKSWDDAAQADLSDKISDTCKEVFAAFNECKTPAGVVKECVDRLFDFHSPMTRLGAAYFLGYAKLFPLSTAGKVSSSLEDSFTALSHSFTHDEWKPVRETAAESLFRLQSLIQISSQLSEWDLELNLV